MNRHLTAAYSAMDRSASTWPAAVLCGVLALASVHAESAPYPAVEITLLESVNVRGPRVTLDDIAILRTRELATMERLMALPLGPAPRAGDSVVVARAALMGWVHGRTRLDSEDVRWDGASEVTLTREQQKLEGGRLRTVASEALNRWLHSRAGRVEWSVVHEPRDLRLPVGEVSLSPRPLAENLPISRRVQVWVDVWVDRQFVRAVPVTFQVRAWQAGWVAMEDLKSGRAMASAPVARREVEVTEGRADFLTGEVLQASPTRLRKSVLAGQPISAGHLEPLPTVTRGDWAVLRSDLGAVSLEARVEVLQDGQRGQWVRVRVPAASASVLARVVAPGVVELTQ